MADQDLDNIGIGDPGSPQNQPAAPVTYAPHDDAKPTAPPADHSDFPDSPFKDGTKHTYYGYKGDVDLDSASARGEGDGGWVSRGSQPRVPHYDVALTKSKRVKLFGGDGTTSTGKEFTEDGHTYRDTDTAPEADDRIDEYAPDHPADPSGTPRYGGELHENKAPIQEWKEAHPELSKYSDDQIISSIKPKVAPNMSDDDFREAAYSPQGQQTIQQAFEKIPILQQMRMNHPEYKDWDDDKLVKASWANMEKRGQTNGMTFEQFNAKLNPPNPVLNSISNFLQSITAGVDPKDPWAGVMSDYGKMFSEAAGVAHESAAGAYGAIEGTKQFMSNLSPLKLADQIAKTAGINMNTQGAYDKFTQQYLKTPFDQYFRRGLNFLNQKSEQQRQAAAANFEKAKDLNPVLKLSADIAGSIPEMTSTFGAGFEAKIASKGEILGRMLWSTMYQAAAQNGKAVEATAGKQFLQQSRAGLTTALQTYLFNSPYGRLTTGLFNAMLGASDQDLHAWIQGHTNSIDEKIEPAIVNFALGYMWGHSDLDEASNADIEASRKALDGGDSKTAKQLLDRSFAMMTEEDQQQHARNFITLTDLLADNTLRGEDIIKAQGYKPLTPATLKAEVEKAQAGTPEQVAENMARIKPTQESVTLGDMESGLSTADPSMNHPWGPAFEKEMAGMMDQTEVPKKAKPLTGTDVNRFTRSYFYNKRSQMGSAINPGQLLIDAGKAVKKAIEPIAEFGHEIHKVLDAGVYGPKSKEAEAEVGQSNAQNQMAQAAYINQKFRELSAPNMVQDLDLYSKRQSHFKKYDQAGLKNILMNMEAGKSTGDPVIDEMKRVYDEINDEFAADENANGITFDLRDNYLMHAWKADKDTKEAWFKSHAKSFGDPSFMKPRDIQTLAQGFSIGKELRSYSPEDLHQGRAYDHFKAMSKVDMLESWHDQGNAFITTEPNLPSGVDLWPPIRSPKRTGDKGTTYYVHPEKAIVIKRAWDPMFDNPSAQKIVGGVIHALKQTKAITVPIRLYSLAHAVHIPAIRFASRVSTLLRDRMQGTPSMGASEWWKALVDAGTGGITQVARDVKDQSRIVGAMQGQVDLRDLNSSEQWSVKQLLDGGFSAGFTDRQKGIVQEGIRRMMPNLKAMGAWNKITELAHKTYSRIDFQHYVFSTMIPSVKVAHVMERIGDLYRDHPELEDGAHEAQRLMELRKITQSADRKFGEMFYDNMFTAKWVKNLGIGVFLSQAWQLGLVDYAGGLVDVGANALKFRKIAEETKNRGAGAGGREYLTDRLLMSYFYTAISMSTGAFLTYLNMKTKPGGELHEFGWMDMFFPWAGKQPNGEDKRYRTMNFPGELLSIGHHMGTEGVVGGLSHTIQNKYSGLMASTIQSVQNTNYLGNKISDSDFYTLQGAYDRMNYIFQNSVMPIGMEQYEGIAKAPDAHKGEAIQDAVSAFLGLNQAPMWTGRTKLANDIIQARHEEKGSSGGQSVEQQQKWEKLDAIRDLINQGGTHEQVKKALDDAVKAGISKKSLQNLQKNIHVSTDKTAFKAMSAEDQIKWLHKMNPEERKSYWPYTHEKARQKYGSTATSAVPK